MFVPAVDSLLTVCLPGESLRAPVVKIIDKNTVFVELTGAPLNPSKSHTYRKGDLVACCRRAGALGETWQALDDRVLYHRPQQEVEPPLPPKKAARKVRAKKAAPVKRKAKATKGGKRAVDR